MIKNKPAPKTFAEYRQAAADILESAGLLADAAIAANTDYEGAEVKPLLDGWDSFQDLCFNCTDHPQMTYTTSDAWYDHTTDLFYHICDYANLPSMDQSIEDAMKRLGYVV